MDKRTRRQFLAGALMTGAGVAILPPVAKASPRRLDLTASPGVADPNFVAGEVVDVNGSQVAVIDPDGAQRQLLISSTAQVWKRGGLGTAPLAVGDGLYARGLINPAGVLDVDNLWVGILNLSGSIVRSASQNMTIALDRTGQAIPARVHPGGMAVNTATGDALADSFEGLSRGDRVRVIGYCSNDNRGGITVTRTFPSLDEVETDSSQSDEGPLPVVKVAASDGSVSPDDVCVYNYKYLATWQCCGGVNACGSANAGIDCSPPPGGTGKCGTCRTDRQGIAWPATYDVNGENFCAAQNVANCNPSADCIVSLPRVNCGQYITVSGLCTGQEISVPVNDCGPCQHCHDEFGCKGYKRVEFDLTACSFTAIGGGLSGGLIDVQCGVSEQC
jgi:hypothetical protein